MSTVLVTGGSGFVGSHCILQLLQKGHQVRATVRSLKRQSDVLAMLREGGTEPGDRLAFFAANLQRDAGWAEAVAGCDYVLHVASPFPASVPRDENELIRPAREGALRVLRAARDAGVKRVVLTSSFAAVSYGQKPQDGVFTEANWTNVDAPDAQPYMKSKTLAERAAWDFIAREGGGLELTVINPVGIFGPVLGPDISTSVALIRMMMNGAMPGAPRIHFGVVDVRDVADLHIRAMTHPAAKGERFLAVAGKCMSILDVAKLLRERMGASAARVPRRQFPDWIVRLFGLFNPAARAAVPQLGIIRNGTSEKARHMLGWAPRSNEEAIVAAAESLVRLKLLKSG
ncbi:MAG: epimerase [Rhizobium sp.]|nr:epimerase [Rhizobium sp.]